VLHTHVHYIDIPTGATHM